ncbi:MAG: hypothetical protein IJ870_05425 [Alphaproteobacteria bacterium]|nr:hypothetical protein [Alphaproteobacteria bacterium]
MSKLCRDIQKKLGYALWQERSKRNLNILAVAEKVNLNIDSFDKIEKGTFSISWRSYQRLLDFYHRDIEITLVRRNERE